LPFCAVKVRIIQYIIKQKNEIEANELRNQLTKHLGKFITATKFSFIFKNMKELGQIKYEELGLVQPNTKIYF